MENTAHIVIIGGGFAGLNAAKALARSKKARITLIDRRNHHLFQPLLYQVATAGLSPAEISAPIRSILSAHENIEVFMDRITGIDVNARKLRSDEREFSYDYLIVAAGASHSYFGHDEWEQYAPGLKTLEQATEIRRRILTAYEEAEKESDPETQRAALTFVIVGGGPTGVELAGSIAELGRRTLARDFRHIDPSRTRVLLIEAGPRVLAGFDERLSARAMRDLEELGVQIWLNSRVTQITQHGVAVGKDFIATKTALWAAGVKTNTLAEQIPGARDKIGRIEVAADLSVPGHSRIFVVGDMAAVKGPDGAFLPGLAPVALQAGTQAARNILRDLDGKARRDFRYFDKGMMATIGRSRAVLQARSFRMTGFVAWLAWLFVHVYYLIGYHNRIGVLRQWAWAYLTFKRGARLIVSRDWRK